MDPVRRPQPLPLAPSRPWHALARLVPGAVSRPVPAGTILRREGAPGGHLVLIESGAVLLSVTAASGRRGCLGVLGPGEVFGIEALAPPAPLRPVGDGFLGGTPLCPEARALTPSRVVRLAADEVLAAMRDGSATARWITEALAVAQSALARRLAQVLTLGVEGRLLALLRDLAAAHGRASDGAVEIVIPFVQDDLAGLVGAARETANRALRDLERRGAIRRDGRRYALVPEALREEDVL